MTNTGLAKKYLHVYLCVEYLTWDDFGWQVIGYLGKEAQNYCTKFFFLFLLLLLISKLVSTALSFLVV